MDRLDEGDLIEIDEDGNIFKDEEKICNGLIIDKEKVENLIKFAYENISEELEKFIDNTIEYAKRKRNDIR